MDQFEKDKDFLEEEMPRLLDQLQSSAKAKWGILDAQLVLEHLAHVFNFSNGKNPLPLMVEPERRDKNRRHFYKYRNPFPKSLAAPMIALEKPAYVTASFLKARKSLDEAMSCFTKFFELDGRRSMHPVLGDLNKLEWYEFQARHVRHHLAQFGLITEDRIVDY